MPDLYDLYLDHPRVSTDTRRIEPDSIFFALRGTSFDGNRFAADALEKGAAYAVVDDPSVVCDKRMILVSDALGALQKLACEHRCELGIPILAITGSNGKTTTKELISRVLSERFEVYATHGNLNNHIGVPLTLLAMTRDTEFGIVEMGASACSEIALLCSIAQPNYGLITNIGRAHLEGFGGPEGVRRGKGELFDFLAENGGRAFVSGDDRTLVTMTAERDPLAVEYYPLALADGIENHLEGSYNRHNIAAAVAIGQYFDVDDERIRHAIATYIPDNNRSQRIETARNTVIADCYNANPSSMRAAIENFRNEKPGACNHPGDSAPDSRPGHPDRNYTEHIPAGDTSGDKPAARSLGVCQRTAKVLILGDMRELGEWSQREHEAVIRLAAEDRDATLLLVGKEFSTASRAAGTRQGGRIRLFPSREELEQHLTTHPIENALILVKGSHGIGLEKILELL